MASSKKNKTKDNQESINNVDGSLNINESSKAIKKKINIRKVVGENKESVVGEKKSSIKGDSKKINKGSGLKKSDEIKESSSISGVVKKNKPKLGSNLADNKSIDKKVGKKSKKSTISGRGGKKVGSVSKVDSKKVKKRKKRKLSDYNLVQRAAWQLLREQGFKGGFKEGCKKVLGLYKDYKELPEGSRKRDNIGRIVEGFLLTDKLVKVNPPVSGEWYYFVENMNSIRKFNPDFKISVYANDTDNYGGVYSFDTNPVDVNKDMRDSGLYQYLKEHRPYRVSGTIPIFNLVESDGYSASYEFLFNGVSVDEAAVNHPSNVSGSAAPSETVRLAEIDLEKRKLDAALRIEEEKTKQKEVEDRIKNGDMYMQMYKDGLISKEEFRKRMGF